MPATNGARVLPLEGLVVLDFTRVLAGPYCTRLLADLGARVLKVERPGEGDEMRRAHLQLDPDRGDQSTYFVRLNAGKLGLALDLGHPEARAVVEDLAARADVAIENFMPGVAARLGCDAVTLRAVRPALVHCSISGFGQTGPLRARPAFAHIIHALSGMMHLEQQDLPAPRPAYLQAADVLAGTHAFGAILAALWRRERTGEGATLDVSMLEALVAAEDVTFGSVLNGGAAYPGPRVGMIVHQVGGRFLALQTVGAPELWARLTRVLGRPDLLEAPRFRTTQLRRDHWAEIRALVVAWLDGCPSADAALAALEQARIPAAPVLDPTEVAGHGHLEERGFFPTVPHATLGRVRVTATPLHLDGAALAPGGPAPYRPGEHTREILEGWLGYSPARVDALARAGVVSAP